jgi:hypothetical protein
MMPHDELEQYVKGLEAEIRTTNQNLGGFQQYVEDKLNKIFKQLDDISDMYQHHVANPDIPGPAMPMAQVINKYRGINESPDAGEESIHVTRQKYAGPS